MGITMTKTIDINIHCFRTFKEDLLHLKSFKSIIILYSFYSTFLGFNFIMKSLDMQMLLINNSHCYGLIPY